MIFHEAKKLWTPPVPTSGIIRDGLYIRYPCDEGSGNVLGDDSGNGYDASLENTGPGNWVPGFEGTAIQLNGSPEHAVRQGPEMAIGGWAAISICIRLKTTRNSGSRFFISFPNTGFTNGCDIHTDAADTIIGTIRNAYGFTKHSFNAAFADDEWHSIIYTYDSDVAVQRHILYYDGVNVSDNPFTDVIANSDSVMCIGRFSLSSGCCYAVTDSLDDIRIYTRALTAEECGQISAGTG